MAPGINRTADPRSPPPDGSRLAPASRKLPGEGGDERSGRLSGTDCQGRGRGVDAWDQYAWIWDAALYGLLALTTLLALLDPAVAAQRWVILGVALLTAGWHLGLWRLGICEQRTELVLVYLAGLFTLWFVLAGLHPAYFSLLLVMYPQIFRHLRLALAVPAAVALTIEVVWREVLASGQPLSETWPRSPAGWCRWCSAACSRSG